jgi:hypothetical protein
MLQLRIRVCALTVFAVSYVAYMHDNIIYMSMGGDSASLFPYGSQNQLDEKFSFAAPLHD